MNEEEKRPEVGKSECPEDELKAEDSPESKVESLESGEEYRLGSPNSAFGIPTSELNKSEITPPLSMEVHHHPEVEKKGIKEYLLEGLMIFLAVMMGFFAENLRERISDNHREHEFAKTLYNELSADSATAAQILKVRLAKEKELDYLYAYFKDSSLTVLPHRFYPAFTIGLYMVNSNTFEPKDGILSQLKNAGGMQYIKSMALQKLLGDLNVSINNIRYRNDQEYQFFAAPVKPFLLKHYDFSWLDKLRTDLPTIGNLNELVKTYTNSNLNIKGVILNADKFDRAEAANMMLFHKTLLVSTRSLQLANYIAINHKILQVLRNTYSLENE